MRIYTVDTLECQGKAECIYRKVEKVRLIFYWL